MAVELWLVRHGQAAFATEDYDRLTDLGRQQAAWLGAHLAARGLTFRRIAAGRLRRQQETAEVMADALGGAVGTVPGLEEYDSDRLLVNAGLRYDRADLGFSGFTDFPAPANTDFDFDDSQLSPSGGAVFDVTDGWSVYASYAESFQAPDPANGDIVGGEPPESELADQWEAGLRYAPSAKWQATLAYFNITKENIVTSDVFGNSQQIGEQFSRGVEFQFTGKPAEGLDVLFGVTWTEAEVEEGRGTHPLTGAAEDLSGRDLAGIPEWAASAAAQYSFDENSPLAGFSVGAGAFYRGAREGDNFGTFELDDYVRVDVNAAYRTERFDARLTIRNVFDEDYFQTANTTVSALPGAPILGELSLNYRF